jgi:hypothetical protein
MTSEERGLANTHPKMAKRFPQNGDTFGLIVVFGKDHVILSVYVRLARQKHFDLYAREKFQTVAAAKVACAMLDEDMQVVVVSNTF